MTRSEAFDLIKSDGIYSQEVMDALEQEPCDDANATQHNSNALNDVEQHTNALEGDLISRQAVDEIKELMTDINGDTVYAVRMSDIRQLPSVTQKSGKCKNCKYFEYDSVAKVDGIPLIVAHEICSRWGDGCKTSEDGYCFLFEPQESEE